jgi:hypothetical protein
MKTRHTRELLQEKYLPPGLQELYGRMMDRIQVQNNEKDARFCLRILRAMTIACRSFHLEELPIFAGLSPELDRISVKELVESCGSFLFIRDDYISFVHLSAKDYFTNGRGKAVFPKDVWADHEHAAQRCFELMSLHLKRNIAGFDAQDASPDDLEHAVLAEVIPRPVQYACLYWMAHVELGSHRTIVNETYVDTFLRRRLLNWLEALSLLKKMAEGVSIIISLYSLLPIAISASQLSPSLHSLLQSTSSSTSTRAHRLSHSNPIIIELSLSQERPSPASIISFSSLLPTPVACGESRCALSFSWSPAFINNRLITSRGGSTLPSSSNRLTFQR